MAEPAFDTLTIAKELEHDYGYEQKQAEGVATIIYRHLVGNVATKDDLRHVKDALEEKIEVQSARIQNRRFRICRPETISPRRRRKSRIK